ncbi:hypothetical protein M2149_001103 [Lachnospiraceae bacterium PFB1-21]|uniref:hypothetical protein n=1 Tax=Ohessyouella blattaphilus TaxID=2949333 RepID=UPI003E1C2C92
MKKILSSKRNKMIALVALLIFTLAIGITLALMSTKTDALTNTFSIKPVESEIEEHISGMNKAPVVRNTGKEGDADCYVRLRVTISPDNVEGREDGGLFTLDYNTTDWTKKDDGFWYYKEALAPGKATTPLFTKVEWNQKDDENNPDYSNFKEFDISLYQESVQTLALNEDGYEVTDAAGVWKIFDDQTTPKTPEP